MGCSNYLVKLIDFGFVRMKVNFMEMFWSYKVGMFRWRVSEFLEMIFEDRLSIDFMNFFFLR